MVYYGFNYEIGVKEINNKSDLIGEIIILDENFL